jgi:hypothetical protein
MPCGYSFSHSKYPLYLSTTFSRVNIEFYSIKNDFLSKKVNKSQNKDKNQQSYFCGNMFETCF